MRSVSFRDRRIRYRSYMHEREKDYSNEPRNEARNNMLLPKWDRVERVKSIERTTARHAPCGS